MSILDANYILVGKILARYKDTSYSLVDIFLTKKGYQKGIGNGKCWDYIDENQINLLEEEKLFHQIDSPKPNPNNQSVNLYHGNFSLKEAEGWYQQQSAKRTVSPSWGWFDRNKNQYQFGKAMFRQTGKIRGPVFQALMELYEKSPNALSVQTLHELTGFKPERIRIEIDAINKNLSNHKVGVNFKGSGKGYYIINKSSN